MLHMRKAIPAVAEMLRSGLFSASLCRWTYVSADQRRVLVRRNGLRSINHPAALYMLNGLDMDGRLVVRVNLAISRRRHRGNIRNPMDMGWKFEVHAMWPGWKLWDSPACAGGGRFLTERDARHAAALATLASEIAASGDSACEMAARWADERRLLAAF